MMLGKPWLCSPSRELPAVGRDGAHHLPLVSSLQGRDLAVAEAPFLSAEALLEGCASSGAAFATEVQPLGLRGHPMISSQKGRHHLFAHCLPGREAHPAKPKAPVPRAHPLLQHGSAILVEDLLSMTCSEIKNKTFKGKKKERRKEKFSTLEKNSGEIQMHLALFALDGAKEKMKL